MAKVLAYGSWPSVITPDALTADVVGISSPVIDGHDLYWNERRPADGGRQVIVRLDADGRSTDVFEAPFSARSRVQEYGGASYIVSDSICWFVNNADQSIYRVDPGEAPHAITPDQEVAGSVRYADLQLHPNGNWIYAVRERHDLAEVTTELVVLSATGEAEVRAVAAGHDFFAAPRCSPDGTRLAYLAWDHPDMPWDSTTCFSASIGEDGALSDTRQIAGGVDVSISQPRFRADNTLCYLSDESDFWTLYSETGAQLAPGGADCASPDWVLGQESYAFGPDDEIFIIRHEIDGERLYHGVSDRLVALGSDYLSFSAIIASGSRLIALAGSPTRPLSLVEIDSETSEVDVILMSRIPEPGVDIAVPSAITFVGGDGLESHAWFYPPTNSAFIAPEGELPPLIVLSHGGPTSAASAVYDVTKQFFTNRGIAVVDVNYGGSSGYGRAYRNRLRYKWGELDVADCVAAAQYLAARGLVDGERLVIRGGSAGGYTTLSALATTDVFAAGSSHYGVSDLRSLATDTHKFESRYLDRLIGAWPAATETYLQRSPLEHADQITCPVIFFQGLDDAIVPPSQAERIVSALKERGIPVAYLPFPGESHGFRLAGTIRAVAVAELTFLGKVLGFEPDTLSDLSIENADAVTPRHTTA